jgi:SEC-C motif-containing protein
MYSSTMEKLSRNDPCPCGSGKKYKKCCLNKDAADMTQLTAGTPDLFKPAALLIAGESHVPAIACEDETNQKFVFVLARASRQMDALEAAEEAGADLDSVPGSTLDSVGPDCLRYLYKIGYRIMPGLKADNVELLEDLLDEEEDLEIEHAEGMLDTLYDTAEQQIREEQPLEVRETLVRLRRAGHSRSAIMDMIVHVMMHESMQAAHDDGEPDIPRYVAALANLPNLSCDSDH